MLRLLAGLAIMVSLSGCANRQGWGAPWGQGTTDRQKARAVVHDPYALPDIGPEVVGGRPREFMNPQAEPKRQHVTDQFPKVGPSRDSDFSTAPEGTSHTHALATRVRISFATERTTWQNRQ